jgi:hypothetical protein
MDLQFNSIAAVFGFLSIHKGIIWALDLITHWSRSPRMTRKSGLCAVWTIGQIVVILTDRFLALLWQIYSRCPSLQIHFRQCGQRSFGGRAISSRMAWRTAGMVG